MRVVSYWFDSWQLLIWQILTEQMTVTDRTDHNYWQDSWQLLAGNGQTTEDIKLPIWMWDWPSVSSSSISSSSSSTPSGLNSSSSLSSYKEAVSLCIIQSPHCYTSGAHIQHRQMTNGLDDNSNELNWSHGARHSKNGPMCWLVIVILHKPKPGVWT